MSSEEERLYARAEMLDETGELAQAVSEVLTGPQGAGVDPAARAALAAAYAMSTGQLCDGCHSARAAAIASAEAAVADAEARIADAERRSGIREAAADILDSLADRLARALAQLRTVPQDLGEVYELIYEFVRSGGKLPRYARWIEGEQART